MPKESIVKYYIKDKEHYVSELQVGADSRYALPVKVITERAWHNVFCQHLFIERASSGLDMQNEWTILNAAKLKMDSDIDGTPDDGVVMINFTEKKVLLCGMLYAGEMKKAMMADAEKMSMQDFIKKYGEENSDTWKSMNEQALNKLKKLAGLE